MTRKDYVLIAATIRRVLDANADAPSDFQIGARRVADEIANALANDNPKFDLSRFLAAAGMRP